MNNRMSKYITTVHEPNLFNCSQLKVTSDFYFTQIYEKCNSSQVAKIANIEGCYGRLKLEA